MFNFYGLYEKAKPSHTIDFKVFSLTGKENIQQPVHINNELIDVVKTTNKSNYNNKININYELESYMPFKLYNLLSNNCIKNYFILKNIIIPGNNIIYDLPNSEYSIVFKRNIGTIDDGSEFSLMKLDQTVDDKYSLYLYNIDKDLPVNDTNYSGNNIPLFINVTNFNSFENKCLMYNISYNNTTSYVFDGDNVFVNDIMPGVILQHTNEKAYLYKYYNSNIYFKCSYKDNEGYELNAPVNILKHDLYQINYTIKKLYTNLNEFGTYLFNELLDSSDYKYPLWSQITLDDSNLVWEYATDFPDNTDFELFCEVSKNLNEYTYFKGNLTLGNIYYRGYENDYIIDALSTKNFGNLYGPDGRYKGKSYMDVTMEVTAQEIPFKICPNKYRTSSAEPWQDLNYKYGRTTETLRLYPNENKEFYLYFAYITE